MEKFWLDEKSQREIKFRAWYIEDSKMFSWEEMKSVLFKWWFEEIVFEYYYYIPMMFTGLKDINNREAYEFDIIKRNLKYDDGLYIIRFGKYWNGEQYEDREGGIGWYATKISSLDDVDGETKKEAEKCSVAWGIEMPCSFEIKGNIFENPELLEEPKDENLL